MPHLTQYADPTEMVAPLGTHHLQSSGALNTSCLGQELCQRSPINQLLHLWTLMSLLISKSTPGGSHDDHHSCANKVGQDRHQLAHRAQNMERCASTAWGGPSPVGPSSQGEGLSPSGWNSHHRDMIRVNLFFCCMPLEACCSVNVCLKWLLAHTQHHVNL